MPRRIRLYTAHSLCQIFCVMKNIFARLFARKDVLPSTLEFTLSDGTVLTAAVRLSYRARRISSQLDSRGKATLVLPAHFPASLLQSYMPDIQAGFDLVWKKYHSRPSPQPLESSLPESIVLPAINETFRIKVETKTEIAALQNLAHAPKGPNVVGRLLVYGSQNQNVLVLESPDELLLQQSNDNLCLCARSLQCWCRIKATYHLPLHLERLAAKGGFALNNVSVRDQRSRWGSCSRKTAQNASPAGNINLNWRALLLPVPLLDHLCWHELCHLLHMNHSPEYHKALARFSPNQAELEKALSRVWRNLPWWTLPENGPATPPRYEPSR